MLAFREFLPQLFSGSMKHNPKIAFRDFQTIANFAVRAFFDFIKLEYLRNARRQFAHGPLQSLAKLGQFHAAAGLKALAGDIVNPQHRIIPGFEVIRGGRSIIVGWALAADTAEMVTNLVP